MPRTSILICSPKYGGCGYIDKSTKWDSYHDGDMLVCPGCGDDHTFQLLKENFASMTEGMCEEDIRRAEKHLAEYYEEE